MSGSPHVNGAPSPVPTHPTPGGPPQMATPMGMAPLNESAANHEIMQIPQNVFNMLKVEIGAPEKDLASLSMVEKARIITLWRVRRSAASMSQPPGSMTLPAQRVTPLDAIAPQSQVGLRPRTIPQLMVPPPPPPARSIDLSSQLQAPQQQNHVNGIVESMANMSMAHDSPVPTSTQPQTLQQQTTSSSIMSGSALLGMGTVNDMDMMFDTSFLSMSHMGDGVYDATGLFDPAGSDINFERDFGQWFQPDESGGGMGPGLDLAG